MHTVACEPVEVLERIESTEWKDGRMEQEKPNMQAKKPDLSSDPMPPYQMSKNRTKLESA